MVPQSVVATTTTLSASATQLTPGQSVTFTVTVSSQSGSNVPTGTVTLLDGTSSLGTVHLNASGLATLSTASLAVGTHSITASYGGDSKDGSSVSSAVSVTVTGAQVSIATTTTLSASSTQIALGQSVTFTAKVMPQAGSNVPTGSVTFLDGTTTLGTSSLNGSATAALTTTALGAGTHSIVASYGGDSQDGSSVSSAVTVSVSVSATAAQGPVATTTTLSASTTQVLPSQSITFNAAVVPHSGSNVPTGTVTFLDGSASLGTAQLNATGGATFNLTSLSLGTHSISASYGGDANDTPSTSAVLTVSVSDPEYAMVVSANSVNLNPGRPSSLTVTLIPENGFNQPIDLSLFRIASRHNLYLRSCNGYPERRASNEHGNDDGPDASSFGPEASSAWCAGQPPHLRLGHALGILLVAGFVKNTKAVAGRSMDSSGWWWPRHSSWGHCGFQAAGIQRTVDRIP